MQPCDSNPILDALESARTKQDVKQLIDRYGYDNVAQHWKDIKPIQQSALKLINFFEGSVIIHELDDIQI